MKPWDRRLYWQIAVILECILLIGILFLTQKQEAAIIGASFVVPLGIVSQIILSVHPRLYGDPLEIFYWLEKIRQRLRKEIRS